MTTKDNHALTIVVCCFNGEAHIEACLASLANQTRDDFSVLIIDDGSNDRSAIIAEKFAQTRAGWTLRAHPENAGLVARCNEAIATIATPFFARLDADDLFTPYAVEKMYVEMARIDDAAFTLFQRWDLWEDDTRAMDVHDDLYEWIAAGTLFRTDAVRAVGGYDKEFWEEYDLYLKLLTQGMRYHVSPFSVYYYRRGQESMTQNRAATLKGFRCLEQKWGSAVLQQYGNADRILSYYQQ